MRYFSYQSCKLFLFSKQLLSSLLDLIFEFYRQCGGCGDKKRTHEYLAKTEVEHRVTEIKRISALRVVVVPEIESQKIPFSKTDVGLSRVVRNIVYNL